MAIKLVKKRVLKILFFVGFTFLMWGCISEDKIATELLLENTIQVTNKIDGGNILSSFELINSSRGALFHMPQATNANWVALSPIVKIYENKKGKLSFQTSKAANVSKIINNIKSNSIDGFMLKPLISFKNLGFEFWGDYTANSEEEWLEVEEAFRELLLAYAATSVENPEVRILCIGNELTNFTKERPDFFFDIAMEIKSKYPNLKLTYAANWDEYEHITFWEAFDFIGVNPYFPLVNKKTPSIEELNKAFVTIKIKLSNLSATYQKPVLFTEYGYRSIDFGGWEGWDLPNFLESFNQYNPDVQVNGYTSFFETFWNEKWVAGGFFWVWEMIPQSDLEGDTSTYLDSNWTVNFKPVLNVIKDYYK